MKLAVPTKCIMIVSYKKKQLYKNKSSKQGKVVHPLRFCREFPNGAMLPAQADKITGQIISVPVIFLSAFVFLFQSQTWSISAFAVRISCISFFAAWPRDPHKTFLNSLSYGMRRRCHGFWHKGVLIPCT